MGERRQAGRQKSFLRGLVYFDKRRGALTAWFAIFPTKAPASSFPRRHVPETSICISCKRTRRCARA